MSRLLATLLALTGLALSTPATASADEAGFISSIDSLNHYAISCPRCAQDAVDVGYRACAGFDRGSQGAVQAVLNAYNGPGQRNQNYYATLFAQYAASELCPEHDGEIGPI